MADRFTTVRNTGTTPVTLDSGAVIGGREYGTLAADDELGSAALERGALVLVEMPEGSDGLDPAYVEAAAVTAERNGAGHPRGRGRPTPAGELGDTSEEG